MHFDYRPVAAEVRTVERQANMQLSEKGLAFIANWEGCVLCAYNDCVGIKTIGYGHVVRPGEHFDRLTKDEALELLHKDVARFEDDVNGAVIVPLTQNQFDALVSFDFNTGGLRKSTLLVKLNAGDYDGALREFPKWCNAGGKPNEGLLNRRKAEAGIFAAPDSHPAPEPIEVTLFDLQELVDVSPHRWARATDDA